MEEANKELEQLRKSVSNGDVQSASKLFESLKLKFVGSGAQPPFLEQTPTAQHELILARGALEQGILLATQAHDDALFERTFMQLKAYYMDARHLMPASQNEELIVGLNLLRLLVQNRVAEFHAEVELMPRESQESPYISHAIALERCLTEGAYKKVLSSSGAPSSLAMEPLLHRLASTVQSEVASCCEASHESLPVDRAKHLLNISSEEEFTRLVQDRGWEIRSGHVVFPDRPASSDDSAQQQVPAQDLISRTLLYAKELERIV